MILYYSYPICVGFTSQITIHLFSFQVNFMITNVLSFRRRRQNYNNQQQNRPRMGASDVQLYRDLAQASGGQAIEVSKSDLPKVTSIITESSSSSLVLLKVSYWSSPMIFVNTFKIKKTCVTSFM